MSTTAPAARLRVGDRFAVDAARVTSVLRVPLIGLLALVGTVVDEPAAPGCASP